MTPGVQYRRLRLIAALSGVPSRLLLPYPVLYLGWWYEVNGHASGQRIGLRAERVVRPGWRGLPPGGPGQMDRPAECRRVRHRRVSIGPVGRRPFRPEQHSCPQQRRRCRHQCCRNHSPRHHSRPARNVTAAQVAEVSRQVELFLSPGDRYDELIRAVIVDVDGKRVVEHYGERRRSGRHRQCVLGDQERDVRVDRHRHRRGIDPGVDATLGELLPRYRDVMLPEVAAVTLEQILTMTAGIVGDEQRLRVAGERRLDQHDRRAHRWNNRPEPPGPTPAVGSHLLSAVLAQATGGPVLDYAREKLFDSARHRHRAGTRTGCGRSIPRTRGHRASPGRPIRPAFIRR